MKPFILPKKSSIVDTFVKLQGNSWVLKNNFVCRNGVEKYVISQH